MKILYVLYVYNNYYPMGQLFLQYPVLFYNFDKLITFALNLTEKSTSTIHKSLNKQYATHRA